MANTPGGYAEFFRRIGAFEVAVSKAKKRRYSTSSSHHNKVRMTSNILVKSKAWRAVGHRELNRLGSDNKTSDWQLPGGGTILDRRTHGKKKKQEQAATLTTDENDPPPNDPTLTLLSPDNHGEDDTNDEDNNKKDDDPTRIILETRGLRNLLERNISCQQCGSGAVKVEFKSIAINSHVVIHCQQCKWCDRTGKGRLTDFPLPEGSGSPLIERTTDYASNVLYVISHLSVGDGGREAERHLTFLGLPNATTMEKNSFPAIEERISPVIRALNKEILKENLIMEVELVMMMETTEGFDATAFAHWKAAITDDNIDMANAILPEVVVASDMGWQKRSSGRKYDSNTGHALLVGKETRLPVAFCLKSKICTKCDYGAFHNVCFKNHFGSSKAMEPAAILDMTVELFDDHNVVVSQIISDDDSSIKAKLRYSTTDYKTKYGVYPTMVNPDTGEVSRRPNKGHLPLRIPKQPTFLADPNHRKKTLKNQLYKLKGKKVNERLTITTADIVRIGKNFAYMCRTLSYKQPAEYLDCGKAVLEHHFDNHQYCGDWCRRKNQTDEERGNKFYRCKTKDAKLYSFLKDTIERFITMEALTEVAHGSDTQVNESFNNTAAWVAPKNKTYGGSYSLYNRLCVAIGILSIGTYDYYVRLFAKLGIDMPETTRHSLLMKSNTRATKLAKTKLSEYKKNRMKKEHENLKKSNEEAREDRCNREGVAYLTGVGMGGGYTQEEIDDANAAGAGSTNKRKRASASNSKAKYCKACEGTDHCRITSTKCAKHGEWLLSRDKVLQNPSAVATREILQRDGDQQAQFDTIPFNDDIKDTDAMDSEESGDMYAVV